MAVGRRKSPAHTAMAKPLELQTDRLRLRQWRDDDREPFASLCADPRVMELLTSKRDRATSDSAIDRWKSRVAENGRRFWALELRKTGPSLALRAWRFLQGLLCVLPSKPLSYKKLALACAVRHQDATAARGS